MAATKYTYSITGDFPNELADANRISQEISLSSITTALDYIEMPADRQLKGLAPEKIAERLIQQFYNLNV